MPPKDEKRALTYWETIWRQFKHRKTGVLGLIVIALFCLVGIYAPFLASSKPIVMVYQGELYFPLFRYLFFQGFFTKYLDLFFNLLIFTLPLLLLGFWLFRSSTRKMEFWFLSVSLLQCLLFAYLLLFPVKDPAYDENLAKERYKALQSDNASFALDLNYMNDYAKINAILRYRLRKEQDERIKGYLHSSASLPTLWQGDLETEKLRKESLKNNPEALQALENYQEWLKEQNESISFILMPFLSHFHWEDDAGGSQSLNLEVQFLDLTRINRKSLVAALIFGVRVSLVVGIVAVGISLLIGIPIGAVAGYYGGKTDIIISRLLEIWETMPAFLMLLMVVAIAQTKSIFLVISVIGLFGWTGFSRYIRAEFFKQRNLSYVEACESLGFSTSRIIFRHILPNAIPPILTLMPFAVMSAISSEAGLSFLGLGEEGSCSWGVLMDEGRSAFPGESYLLWPPAILLTILLIAAALVGDALRDAFDPKMHR